MTEPSPDERDVIDPDADVIDPDQFPDADDDTDDTGDRG
jgi:hypothetical protein